MEGVLRGKYRRMMGRLIMNFKILLVSISRNRLSCRSRVMLICLILSDLPGLFSQGDPVYLALNPSSQNVSLDSKNYCEIRNGLLNSYFSFTHKKTGRVAFMGGSITQNAGWRDMICQYLKERFPETKFEFINAGISSTGSTPGAFRFKSDVLDKGEIDLLFEEAAVNDRTNMFDSTACIRGIEGIVSHARRANPFMDIVIMYFVDPDKMKDYNNGIIPYEIKAHDKVAEKYKIPSVNLAKEVTDRINNHEFTWEKDFVDLHPSDFGQKLYYNSIRILLESCWNQAEKKSERVPYQLPEMIDKFSYINGEYVNINNAKPDHDWTFIENWSPANSLVKHKMCVNVPVLFSGKPGAEFGLSFKGKAIGICAVTGPDAGIIKYSIDGKYSGTVDLYTQWSSQYDLPWFVIFEDELSKSDHFLKLKISDKKNMQSEGNACYILKFLVNR